MKILSSKNALACLIPWISLGACAATTQKASCDWGGSEKQSDELSGFLRLAFENKDQKLFMLDEPFLQDYYKDLSSSSAEYTLMSDSSPSDRRVAMSIVYSGADRSSAIKLNTTTLFNSNFRASIRDLLDQKHLEFEQISDAASVKGSRSGTIFSFHILNEQDSIELEFDQFVDSNSDIFGRSPIRVKKEDHCVIGLNVDQDRVVSIAAFFRPIVGSGKEKKRWDFVGCREAYFAGLIGLRNFPILSFEKGQAVNSWRRLPIRWSVWNNDDVREVFLSSSGKTYEETCSKIVSAFQQGDEEAR